MHRDAAGPTGGRPKTAGRPWITHWGQREADVGMNDVATTFLNEDVERRRRTVLTSRQRAFYLHVDDGMTAAPLPSPARPGSGPRSVEGLMRATADSCEQDGFVVDDRRGPMELGKILGFEVERRPARIIVAKDRAVNLYEAMSRVLVMRRVPMPILATLVGGVGSGW